MLSGVEYYNSVVGYASVVAAVYVPDYECGIVAMNVEMPVGVIGHEYSVGSGVEIGDTVGDDAVASAEGDGAPWVYDYVIVG